MKQTISDEMLEKASTHIAEQMGLHFPSSKWRTLEQAFCRAARELDFQNPLECAAWFVSAPPSRELMDTMACYLTVGETYFLRENRTFEIMEQEIIPELIRTRQGGERRLRIWSVGCATGEEPYSIAILLQRMSHLLKDWEICILATDINAQALAKAAAGVYTEWSFRNPPKGFRDRYFRKTEDGRFELDPNIRRMVSFSCLNLAKDLYPSLSNNTNAMDMVFCRNVLMYLTPERAAQVIERLRLCLVDGGWLLVSPCEASSLLSSRFKAMSYPDAIVYRKQSTEERGNGAEQNRRNGETGKRGNGEEEQMRVVSPIPPFSGSPVQIASPAPFQAVSPYEEALALYGRGQYSKAAERLTPHLLPERGDAASFALLCRIRANEGRLGEALLLSEQAIAADKMNAGLHYLRAVILQEQGEIEAAVITLKRALYLDQELILAHFSLGNLSLRQGREKESRRYFDNTLALLKRYRPDEIVPESEGMLAGRLVEIIESTSGKRIIFKPDKVNSEEMTLSEPRRFSR